MGENMIRYWQHKFTLIVMSCLGGPEPADDWIEISKQEYETIIDALEGDNDYD